MDKVSARNTDLLSKGQRFVRSFSLYGAPSLLVWLILWPSSQHVSAGHWMFIACVSGLLGSALSLATAQAFGVVADSFRTSALFALMNSVIGTYLGALSSFLYMFLTFRNEEPDVNGFGTTVPGGGPNPLIILGMSLFAGLYSYPICAKVYRFVRPTRGTTSEELRSYEETLQTLAPGERTPVEEDIERRLRNLLSKNPGDVPVNRLLIKILRRQKRTEEAAEQYDTLIRNEPANVELIREKAMLYEELGDHRRYIKTLEQIEKIQADASFEQNVGVSIELRQLEVRDIEFFDDFKWALRPKVNVLLGNNGYGKSHLLRMLVAMVQNDEQVTARFFEDAGPTAAIQLDIAKEDKLETSIRRFLVFEKSFGKAPILAIPDVRYFDRSSDSVGAPREELSDLKSQGASHFLQGRPYEARILNFLYELCFDYFENGRSFDLPIFKLIQDSFQKLSDGKLRFHEIVRRDNARFDIRVFTEGNENKSLSLQKVSQGTLSVLTMVGLTYRYLKALYPEVPEATLCTQKAIVIIDEIDAHLHPTWQQKILQLFRDTFPNIQFIVTAHSPLVVAGCLEGEVAILQKTSDGFKVEVSSSDFIGATSEELYKQVFRVVSKDATYNRLNTLRGTKGRTEGKVRELEAQPKLSPEKMAELESAKVQLYYLNRFDVIREKQEKENSTEQQRRKLETEVMRLRGELSSLKSQAQAPESMGFETGLSKFLGNLGSSGISLVKPVVQYLASRGQFKEASLLAETLSKAEPQNLEILSELAVLYESTSDYSNASRVLRQALSIAPANKELQEALARIGSVLQQK